MFTKSSKILKSVAIVTVFSVFTRTLAFIFKIYLSRKLGAEVVGLYQICLSLFFLFAGVSASGITTVLSRKTAEQNALKGKRGFSLTTSALIISGSVSLATVLLLFLLRPYLSYIISDSRAVPLFMIMAPALITTTVYNVIRASFWGNKAFATFSATEMIEEVLRILFTLLFVSGVVSGVSGAYGIALAFTVSDLSVAIILFALYFIKGGRLAKPSGYKELFKPSIPVTAMRVFGSLAGAAVALLLPARLIFGGLSVADATAAYGRVAGMANPLLFAPNAIISSLAIVLIPEMSENRIKGDFGALNRQINTGITVSVLISGAFMAIFLSVGKELCEVIFADTAAGEYLEKAAFIMLLSPISLIATSTLNSIGMEKEAFLTFVAGTVLLLLCVYVLPPYLGVYSLVAANAASLLVSVPLALYFLRKKINLSFKFIKSIFLIGVMVFPSYLISENLYALTSRISPYFALFLAVAVSLIFYAALSIILNLIDVSGFLLNFRRKPATRKASIIQS